jgi:3-phenylpropionate/cinnamic acid dioxygenase small subunit
MKTAVDYIVEMASELGYVPSEFYDKAKELEKEQIKKANMDGYKEGCTYHSFDHQPKTTEEYYNQTYNQKEETLEEWKSKFTHHCAIKDNQKQHIIDIMKADEDNGLYNQNK